MIRVDHPPHDVAAEQDAEPDNGQLRGEAGGERAEGPGRIAPLHGGLEIGGRSDRKLSLRETMNRTAAALVAMRPTAIGSLSGVRALSFNSRRTDFSRLVISSFEN